MQSLTLNLICASSCSYGLWFNAIVDVEVRFLLRGCVVGMVGSSAWVGRQRHCVAAYWLTFKVLLSSVNDAMERSSSSYTSKARSRVLCLCNIEAPLVTSWTEDNPGRRFYGCGLYKVRKNNFVGGLL